MAPRRKVTVSLDGELVSDLGAMSRKSGTPLSRLVEDALCQWQRQQLDQALREGYQAMAKQGLATARRYRRVVRRALG